MNLDAVIAEENTVTPINIRTSRISYTAIFVALYINTLFARQINFLCDTNLLILKMYMTLP